MDSNQATILTIVVIAQLFVVPLLGGAMLLLTSKLFGISGMTYARCWWGYFAAYVAASIACAIAVFALSGEFGTIFLKSSTGQILGLFGLAMVVHWIVVPLVLRATYLRAIVAQSLAVLLTCGILAALIIPAVSAARKSARLALSKHNVSRIMIAMHEFCDRHPGRPQRLPARYTRNAENEPLLSWRVHLLPYMNQAVLYDQFHLNEPWNSPHNLELVKHMPAVYQSPGDSPQDGKTQYLAPVGEFTIFPKKMPPLPRSDFSRAEFRPPDQSEWGFGRISDGTSRTIGLVEVTPDRAVVWTKPDDWEYSSDGPFQGLVHAGRDFFVVGMFDGRATTIPRTVDKQVFLNALDPRDGQDTELP